MGVINGQAVDVNAAVQAVRDVAIDRAYLGPEHGAASSPRPPTGASRTSALNDGNLVQLGHGKRQHRIWTAETDRTSAIAEGIARDKDLTKRLLTAVGVPVPEGRIADSAAEAWEAAEDDRLPVAVKPSDGNHGRGVTLDLTTREQVEAAWVLAEQGGQRGDRRALHPRRRAPPAGGRPASWWRHAARRPGSTATGARRWRSWSRRSSTTTAPRRDRRPSARPHRRARGRCHRRRPAPPGTSPPTPCPRPAGACSSSATATWRSTAPTRSTPTSRASVAGGAHHRAGHRRRRPGRAGHRKAAPLQQQAAVVEVNAGPGLLSHLKPAVGSPRPVGKAIVDHLFPPGDDGRIPLVGIAGGGSTTPHRAPGGLAAAAGGRQVGWPAARASSSARGASTSATPPTGALAERLLINRDVDAAVFENDAAHHPRPRAWPTTAAASAW